MSMKQITITDIIGALCQDDYKGINSQYINQGKVVVVESIRRIPIRGMERVLKNRTTTGFRWKYGGGVRRVS